MKTPVEETYMTSIDLDTDLEQLMRRWHHLTELSTATWAEYQALRDVLPASDRRVTLTRSRWLAAERERRAVLQTVERLEESA
jgi:hypothetical protein